MAKESVALSCKVYLNFRIKAGLIPSDELEGYAAIAIAAATDVIEACLDYIETAIDIVVAQPILTFALHTHHIYAHTDYHHLSDFCY